MRFRHLFIERFRGRSFTLHRDSYPHSGFRVRLQVTCDYRGSWFTTTGTRFWLHRHPIDGAIANGFGFNPFGFRVAGMSIYRSVATHISVGPLCLSFLGRLP
jgi:hypothetical protein